MTKVHRDKSGFTLVEVIVAIAILGLLSTLFAQISFSSLKARSASRERLEAVAIATSAIDEIKSFRGNQDNEANVADIWNTVAYLKGRLGVDDTSPGPLGYTVDIADASGNTFLRTYRDTNNIEYNVKILIDENNGAAHLFDLMVIVNSPNVKDWKAVTRIRGK